MGSTRWEHTLSSCPSGFLAFPFPLLTLASFLPSSRSSESEASVRRKVSLVLEQMQPLGVSGLLGVRARVGARALRPPGMGMRAPFPPLVSQYLGQMVSPASTKALAGQAELTRKMEELQKKLDEEVKVRLVTGGMRTTGKMPLAFPGDGRGWLALFFLRQGVLLSD